MYGSFDPAKTKKRTIGPVPPRDKQGKLLIAPVMEKRPKLNVLGEPIRDKDGQPIEELVDSRLPWEYRIYEPGFEKHILPEALKGLRLFEVDFDLEPRMLVFAKDAEDAVRVWKKEWGVIKLSGEADEPKVTEVAA